MTTDESGVFAFTALRGGMYSLLAEKSTYLPARYPESGQTMRSSSRPIPLRDGETLDSIVIKLYHGSAIAGRVVDSHGDPVENVQVSVMRLPRSGRARPQMRGGGSSNDIGEFRVARLEPGRYLLAAFPRRFGPPDDSRDPEPVMTFYPGVTSIDQAQPISIERAMSVTGLELALVDGVMATITGSVVDQSGQPVTRNASVSVRTLVRDDMMPMGVTGTGVKPDGTFQLKLAPGEYEVDAQSMRQGTPGPPQPGDQQFGSVRLNVSGDMAGVTIQVGRGAKISGRVLFDGSSPLPTLPINQNMTHLAFMNPDGGSNCRAGRNNLALDWTFTVEDVFGTCMARLQGSLGAWTLKSIQYDGQDLLDRPITFAAGQQLKDVQVVLTDKRSEVTLHVSDDRGQTTKEFVGLLFAVDKSRWGIGSRFVRPYVPPPDPVDGAAPAASGTSAGSMVAGANLIVGVAGGMGGSVFGSTEVPGLNLQPASRPNTIVGLPAGEYYAIAVDDMEPDVMRDPELLERLSHAASRVTLSEGSQIEVTLRRFRLSDLIGDR